MLGLLTICLTRAGGEVKGIQPPTDTSMRIQVPLGYAANNVRPDLVDTGHLRQPFGPVVAVDAVDVVR